jgi:hypothetical protein
VLQRLGDSLRAALFEHASLQIEGITVLSHLLRPLCSGSTGGQGHVETLVRATMLRQRASTASM